jgi:predicted 3-demethylubiquinone-9 3-methyltransferase (glyoxalase superfamily)
VPIQQKITPHLWFDTNAEEAVKFYITLFDNSKILNTSRDGDAGPGSKGSVMVIGFQLAGQSFTAINGVPHFKFNAAVSFLIACDTQQEIDRLWDKLIAGGQEQQCGWLQDRFGLVWQVNYSGLSELMGGTDAQTSSRSMKAMMQMKKIDIQQLKDAYAGRT